MKIKGVLYVKCLSEIEYGVQFLMNRFMTQWSIIDDTIIEKYAKHSEGIYSIYLKNGDKWDIMPATSCNCCGRRYNVVLYDSEIKEEIIKTLILPSASIGLGLSFPVDIYEEYNQILTLEDINYII